MLRWPRCKFSRSGSTKEKTGVLVSNQSLLSFVDAFPLYDLAGVVKVAAIFPELSFFQNISSPWPHKP